MKLLVLAMAFSLLAASPALGQTVVLVRHAEKADNGADPVLSEAGEARARALVQVVADSPPTHVLTSTLKRTIGTAQPVAHVRGLMIDQIAIDAGAAAHVANLTARVRALPNDAVVLVVGHSNTVPLIARALGYAAASDMQECEYDRLTVLDLDDDHTSAIVGRYGAPANCE